jgi:glycosyltransferase involved in cell wall biosynthesis
MTETIDQKVESPEPLTEVTSHLPPPPKAYDGPKLSSLSAFMPAYNEEANIRWVAEDVLAKLRQVTDDLELIIVNDGSKDRTGEIIDNLEKQYPEIVAKHHPQNQGYGAALRTGFAGCRKDFIFYTDGDGQFDAAEISRLIPLLQNADIVSAYRVDRKDPWIRKLNAWLYNGFLLIFFRLAVRDVDCAFKLYRARFFDKVNLKSDGALIDAEVLIKLKKAGAKIAQVGVHHYPRLVGEQTGSKLKVILRTAREIRENWRDLI